MFRSRRKFFSDSSSSRIFGNVVSVKSKSGCRIFARSQRLDVTENLRRKSKHRSEMPPGLDSSSSRGALPHGCIGKFGTLFNYIHHLVQPFSLQRSVSNSFFEALEVRLCWKPCLVDVVPVLISESRHQGDPITLQHRDGLAVRFGDGVNFRVFTSG